MDIGPIIFQRFDYVAYVQYQLIAGAMMMCGLGLWSLHTEVKGLTRITLIALSVYIVYLLENSGMLRIDIPLDTRLASQVTFCA